MQAQERDLISGLFGRMQQFEAQPRDPEAEALIATSIARQPATPYLLVQTVLVQEQALKAAQERIAELEARSAAAPAASAGSFLANAPKVSPWGAAAAAPAPVAPPAPSTRSPLQAAVAPQQAAGGGFLRTAMATAAGVAGGALLFEGIRSLMGHNPGPFGQTAASPAPAADAQQQAMLSDDSEGGQGGGPDDSYDIASDDSGFGGGSDDDSFA